MTQVWGSLARIFVTDFFECDLAILANLLVLMSKLPKRKKIISSTDSSDLLEFPSSSWVTQLKKRLRLTAQGVMEVALLSTGCDRCHLRRDSYIWCVCRQSSRFNKWGSPRRHCCLPYEVNAITLGTWASSAASKPP